MSVTGLTDDAVYFLNTLKDCNDPIWRDGLKAVNTLLSESHFDGVPTFGDVYHFFCSVAILHIGYNLGSDFKTYQQKKFWQFFYERTKGS